MYLSKSKYVSGCQCPKILWMGRHMPEQYVSTVDEAVVATGNEVGDLAMGYYGDFVEIPYDRDDYAGMARRTAELIEAGTPVVCEATLIYGENFCMADILLVEPDGVRIVEVKSSTEVKAHYVDDVAYQVWVARMCGLNVKSAGLMHLNRGYVRDGELDLRQLFVVEDLTEQVMAKQGEVAENVERFDRYCACEEEPGRPIGTWCSSPHPCAYAGWCWRDVPHPGVTDIKHLGKAKACKLHNEGVRTFEDVLEAGAKLSTKQLLQVRTEVEGLPDQVDAAGIRGFLETLRYPLYFLDFETFMPAIPVYDGTRPYQQVTTQYSLHILDEPGGALEHREFLANERLDPLRQVAEHLVADIPAGACTLAWNKGFECGRIAEMAAAFPDLAGHLTGIREAILDLSDPFKAGCWYNRAMQGSWSIKYVLPALFPDDPELDYHALEGVHHGGEAMEAFGRLPTLDLAEREAVREQLLRYCELDTYAMVKILERLYEAVGKDHVCR